MSLYFIYKLHGWFQTLIVRCGSMKFDPLMRDIRQTISTYYTRSMSIQVTHCSSLLISSRWIVEGRLRVAQTVIYLIIPATSNFFRKNIAYVRIAIASFILVVAILLDKIFTLCSFRYVFTFKKMVLLMVLRPQFFFRSLFNIKWIIHFSFTRVYITFVFWQAWIFLLRTR